MTKQLLPTTPLGITQATHPPPGVAGTAADALDRTLEAPRFRVLRARRDMPMADAVLPGPDWVSAMTLAHTVRSAKYMPFLLPGRTSRGYSSLATSMTALGSLLMYTGSRNTTASPTTMSPLEQSIVISMSAFVSVMGVCSLNSGVLI